MKIYNPTNHQQQILQIIAHFFGSKVSIFLKKCAISFLLWNKRHFFFSLPFVPNFSNNSADPVKSKFKQWVANFGGVIQGSICSAIILEITHVFSGYFLKRIYSLTKNLSRRNWGERLVNSTQFVGLSLKKKALSF